MTDEQINAANVILSKMIFGDPRTLGDSLFKSWLAEEKGKNNDRRFTTILTDTSDSNYNIVHGFLLTNGYIGRVAAGHEEKYLTEKGAIAKQLGGINEYLSWKRKKNYINKIKEFAFWATFVFAFLSALYAVLGHYSIGKTKTLPKMKSDSTQPKSSSGQSHQPTTASIKDSLKYKDSLANTKSGTLPKATSALRLNLVDKTAKLK